MNAARPGCMNHYCEEQWEMEAPKSWGRVVIESVEPELDCGRYAVKRTPGEKVVVEADIIADGHDVVSSSLLFRKEGASDWSEVSMAPHGDYHLGQLLYTGKDFVIITSRGACAPARRATAEAYTAARRRRHASLLRLCGHVAAFELRARGMGHRNFAAIESWARSWYCWVSTVFLKEYLRIAGAGALLPRPREDLRVCLKHCFSTRLSTSWVMN
jgi:predicted trehalose synthase